MKKYVIVNSEPADLQIHLNDASEKGWEINSILGPFVGGTLMVVLEADKRPEIPVAHPAPAPTIPLFDSTKAPEELKPYYGQEAPVVVREIEVVKCSCGEFAIRDTEYCGPNGCLEVKVVSVADELTHEAEALGLYEKSDE